MSNLQACVLAAGKGTRMRGDKPKVLFETNGKPLLEWVLSALSEAGVDDCVTVVGFKKDEVTRMLPTGVRWAEQSPQLGTGHAVKCARVAFHDHATNLIVTYGDMPLVTPGTYGKLVRLRESTNADASMLTVPIPPDSRFGRIVRDGHGAIASIVEFKDASPEQRTISEGNAGVYCFRPATLWPALEKITNNNAQGEYYLTDLIAIFLADNGKVVSLMSDTPGEELGVNTPEDLDVAEQELKKRTRS